jgi:hypothetical protein
MGNSPMVSSDYPLPFAPVNITLRQHERCHFPGFRLIGSVRQELLDHTFFCTATDLENTLREHQCHYNECRTHSGRGGSTPIETTDGKVIDINKYRWEKHY